MKHIQSVDEAAERRLSHILPTKGRPELLEKALEHHRELVSPDDELIVISGGTDAETREVVDRFSDLVDIYLEQEDDTPIVAFNRGLLLARGKYARISSDDDTYDRQALDRAVEVLEENPQLDVVQCGGVREVDGQIVPFYIPPEARYGHDPQDVFRFGVCGQGFVVRRQALANIGLFNSQAVANDGEFLIEAIRRGANVRFLRVRLFHHPIWSQSVTRSKRSAHEADVKRLVRKHGSLGYRITFYMRRVLWKVPGLRPTMRWLRRVLGGGSRSKPEPVWDGRLG